eukprot:4208687-Heterocapsa_arctica.AAC.1
MQALQSCSIPDPEGVIRACSLGVLQRRNSAMQVVESNTCGAFVLFWMEQAVRVHPRGESPCSM